MMSRKITDSLFQTIGTIFIGIVILLISTTVLIFAIPTVLLIVNPPLPICSEVEDTVSSSSDQVECVTESDVSFGYYTFHNASEFVLYFVIFYVLSVLIISFLSGYYLNGVNVFAWQSFLSGFIIGFIGPGLFALAGSKIHIQDVMYSFTFGIITGFIGLVGYAVAGWRKRRIVVSQ